MALTGAPFHLTKDHITLLQSVNILNDVHGQAMLDPTAFYRVIEEGNIDAPPAFSVAKVLGIKPEGEDGEYTEFQFARFVKLHEELAYAMQIALWHGSSKLGYYARVEHAIEGFDEDAKLPHSWWKIEDYEAAEYFSSMTQE